jgi:hypothetical protein
VNVYSYDLSGLESDNLLAFLALLGLLRALERSRPSWFARASFGGTPLVAKLHVVLEASEEEIARAAAEGCAAYAGAFEFFGLADLKFSADTGRTLLEGARSDPNRARLYSALFSDGAVRPDGDVYRTPLCLMLGAGHQHFLSRLENIGTSRAPKSAAKAKGASSLGDPVAIERALFAAWRRADQTDSFQWDAEDLSLYALSARNPSSVAKKTEHGANRLAILGLLSFQTAPQAGRRWATVDLATRGFSRGGKHRRVRLTWPIWERPATRATIEAMLDESSLALESIEKRWRPGLGIRQVRRSIQIQNGYYLNFRRAETLS